MANQDKSEPTGEPAKETPAESLGSILEAARRRKGLAIDQLAAKLRVDPQLLKALEEDRLDDLPAPVFVKGYIKNLANRFGLEYEDLLGLYMLQTDATDSPVTYAKPIGETSMLTLPLIVGALVLVLGVPAFWLTWVGSDTVTSIISSDGSTPGLLSTDVEADPEVAPVVPDDGPTTDPASAGAPQAQDAEDPGVAGSAAPQAESATGPAVPGSTAPQAQDPASPQEEVPAAPDPAPATPDPAPAAPDAAAAAPDATVAAPDATPATPDATPAAPEAAPTASSVSIAPGPDPSLAVPIRVAIRFVEDSWTEAYDRNGNALYYALGEAGTTADFSGMPPLSFALGNSGGVELTINEQPYPLPPLQGNASTLRFLVAETP